jgi:cytochrome P450
MLARLEMRIFFNQLMPRIEKIELLREPEHLRASFVHGLKHLPIRVAMRRA